MDNENLRFQEAKIWTKHTSLLYNEFFSEKVAQLNWANPSCHSDMQNITQVRRTRPN